MIQDWALASKMENLNFVKNFMLSPTVQSLAKSAKQ